MPLFYDRKSYIFWNTTGDKVAWSQTTDNMYITILMNYGVFGFLLFLQMIIYAIKRVIYTTDKNVLFGCSGLIAIFLNYSFLKACIGQLL